MHDERRQHTDPFLAVPRKPFSEFRRCSNGSVLLEAVISLPLLILLIGGIVDIGRGLNQYMTMTRIAYESSRYAASISGLQSGCFSLNTNTPACAVVWPKVFQSDVKERLETLITSNQLPPPSEYSSQFTQASAGSDRNTVKVSLKAPYKSLLLPLVELNLSVSATAPYLYPEREA